MAIAPSPEAQALTPPPVAEKTLAPQPPAPSQGPIVLGAPLPTPKPFAAPQTVDPLTPPAARFTPAEGALPPMAVASGNDACIAIAEHFGGIPAFVSLMNRKAQELGMTGTHFVNPNGLPAPGQLTTARDLTKLATSYLRHYPQALRYHSTTEINHRGAVHGNSNHLLGAVDGVDGIKTGYVDASGYNIVATAKRGDTRIIAVVLGGRTKGIRNHETTRILNAAFSGSVDSMSGNPGLP